MATLKVGDVVQLKSGGPTMTIKIIDTELELVTCSWFVKTDLKTGHFHPDQLTPA